MTGVNWTRQPQGHWSRLETETEVSGEINKALILEVHRLAGGRVDEKGMWSLLRAVAIANQSYQVTQKRAATNKDAKAQLKAMLKMDDSGLSKALELCDKGTLGRINKAQNDMDMSLRTKWVFCDDPDAIPGIQIPAPESVRQSVQIALDCLGLDRCGPKGTPHQRNLVRACLAVWDEYLSKHNLPARTQGRLAFVRAAFEAAGMVLGDKRLEELMAKSARLGKKKRSN